MELFAFRFDLALFRHHRVLRPTINPFLFDRQLTEDLVNLQEGTFLDLGSDLVSFVPLHVVQIVFVVLVAYLAIRVIAVRHWLWNLTVVDALNVEICFKLTFEVFFVFFLSLLHYFVELVSNELEFSFADTRTEPVRRVHLEFMNVQIRSLRLRKTRIVQLIMQ